ncbi:MAG: type II toxin-antitoxin system prevent-host-death family antitoxin [Eubacteriales bacterium]|nr:type II toxin-antitoxin system prevent-host-death family antitoxin [Eubacteriales bacterium]
MEFPLFAGIFELRTAHKEQEPIFITKNGYSDLVVMSSELYDRFAKINRIDQVIYESEKEMQELSKT